MRRELNIKELPKQEEERTLILEEELPEQEQLDAVSKLISDYSVNILLVEKLEKQVEEAKAKSKNYSEKLIPDAFNHISMRDFSAEVGPDVISAGIKPFVHGSISEENKEEVYSWLEKTGNSAIIKGEMKLPFKRGAVAFSDAMLKLLMSPIEEEVFSALAACGSTELAGTLRVVNSYQEVPEVKETIHHKTLDAFLAKELEERREGVPTKLFSIHEGFKTKLKKEKK